jgi:hypothetical protein
METPLPAGVPPQLPEYHFQLAPVPRLPPKTDNVVLLPEQMLVTPEIPVGSPDIEFIEIEAMDALLFPHALDA